MKADHTFAICAYKESPYLEECVNSLIKQTIKSELIIATSTLNEHILEIGNKYNIPVFINNGETGITQDWNFAYSKAETKYITIAHQDDVYDERYTEKMIKLMNGEKKPLIFFTDYYEIRDGKVIKTNKLLKVKRILLFPMRLKINWKSKFVRRRVLSMGSSICCPSVTFAKNNLPNPIFNNHFRSNEDWEAWEKISRLKGSFIFCNLPLTYHRIHEDSETSATIRENGRTIEDLEMFRKFWPKTVAKLISKLYGTSEKSNDIN